MENKPKFHVGLNVADIGRTSRFYEKFFNRGPVKIQKDYVKFELDDPGLVISFMETKNKVRSDFGHLGFRVNSVEELAQKKQNVQEVLDISLEEENTACCYAKQDKFWVTDPDGYEWEVYHFIEDINTKGESKSLNPCC